MGRELAAWCAFWAGFAVLDNEAAKRGQSLCATTRWAFRTDTPSGRARFTAAYLAGAYVLHRHVLGPTRKAQP